MSTLDVVLWAVGILISVLLAFLAVKRIRKSQKQSVRAGKGSTVIQSGRDTNIR
ncbi:beta-lactamase regulating signal transducer with metallopeptidase domain [Rhizobium miluonense]|uniref:Beta-lactamase regulating signal transducer with metallopeptidase domain n=1 Tax=Rhizobium miluonense TaxID=411945 RepID=A0ABU1SZ93_9HYPH|nr:beta-lactamase regulating signal transducer with metallopeptidase domain [Rhizobium miluonense]